jgi:hypothetical protein
MHNRHRTLAVFALLFALISGCVPSFNPLYTEKDLIFDSRLVGAWTGEEGELWRFIKDGEKKYKLTYTDNDGKATFEAHLFKLKDRHFLNLYLHDDAEGDFKLNALAKGTLFPMHLFLRVDEIGTSLKMAAANPTWLEEHLEANPKATPHLKQKERILLTGTPLELQAFVLEHVDGEALFGGPFTVQRKSDK